MIDHLLSRLRPLCLATVLVLPGTVIADNVGALGRIIPSGDVIALPGSGTAVTKIHVQVGDVVAAGDPLITFSPPLGADDELELAKLDLQQANEIGARNLKAAQLRVDLAQFEHDFARERYDRFAGMGGDEISPQQMELRAYERESARLGLNIAKNTLDGTREETAFNQSRARTRLQGAQKKLEQTTLNAPGPFTVVKINTTPGAIPTGATIMLADLSQMQVLTEVFAGDIANLKPGQKATISSNALTDSISGQVLRISPLVTGRAKVVEVLLSVDDPATVRHLIHLEVNVSIEI